MDLEAARTASFDTWQAVAGGWERHREWFWQCARPVSELMVERLDPRPGQTILELASGPGDTGFLAAGKLDDGGRLISSDFAPHMVDAARRRAAELRLANAEFRVIDAQQIALDDDSVDGVLCRWGFMLMPDAAAAFGETRRVLRPGGRLVFAVWAQPERNPWATMPRQVLIDRGLLEQPPPGSADMFALGDPSRIESTLGSAELETLSLEEFPIEWRYADAEEHWRSLLDISGSVAAALAPLGPAELKEVRAAVDEKLRQFAGPDGVRIPGVTLVVTASA
jgi:SAM-dependent methyltransferase